MAQYGVTYWRSTLLWRQDGVGFGHSLLDWHGMPIDEAE